MTTAEIYQRLRPLMFSIAYRMLGSVSEAEDIVQEAFLRYHAAQPRQAEIGSPKAYLSAVTTRLCIDHLRSARARREAYPGEWLPEPLLTGEAAGRGPRGRAPSPAATAWPGGWPDSAARSASSASRPGPSRSTGSPVRCSSIRPAT